MRLKALIVAKKEALSVFTITRGNLEATVLDMVAYQPALGAQGLWMEGEVERHRFPLGGVHHLFPFC